MSDITIHIDETLDNLSSQSLQYNLSRVSGVESVDSSEKNPHLMVVSYDHNRVTSRSILAIFTRQGLHAEMIGL